MSVDTIGNFLTVIRNGVMGSKRSVVAPYSKMNANIARILKEEGFVRDVQLVTTEGSVRKQLKVVLKYVDGESVIHELTRISTPSRRMYDKVKNIKPVIDGLGISILSTHYGLLTDKQAKSKQTFAGGEIICRVW